MTECVAFYYLFHGSSKITLIQYQHTIQEIHYLIHRKFVLEGKKDCLKRLVNEMKWPPEVCGLVSLVD